MSVLRNTKPPFKDNNNEDVSYFKKYCLQLAFASIATVELYSIYNMNLLINKQIPPSISLWSLLKTFVSVCRVLLIQLVTHPLKHTHIRTHPHSCLYRKWSDLIGTNFFSCNLIGGNKKLPHVCLMLLSLRVSGDWNERRRPLHLSLHTTNTSLAQTPVCFFYSTVLLLFTPAPSPRS